MVDYNDRYQEYIKRWETANKRPYTEYMQTGWHDPSNTGSWYQPTTGERGKIGTSTPPGTSPWGAGGIASIATPTMGGDWWWHDPNAPRRGSDPMPPYYGGIGGFGRYGGYGGGRMGLFGGIGGNRPYGIIDAINRIQQMYQQYQSQNPAQPASGQPAPTQPTPTDTIAPPTPSDTIAPAPSTGKPIFEDGGLTPIDVTGPYVPGPINPKDTLETGPGFTPIDTTGPYRPGPLNPNDPFGVVAYEQYGPNNPYQLLTQYANYRPSGTTSQPFAPLLRQSGFGGLF